ncbi:MAG: endonuclease/exonuclease/phosphatase family protein [Bacteroidota bacterium]
MTRKTLKRIVKITLSVIIITLAIVLVLAAAGLTYLHLTDYSPPPMVNVVVQNNTKKGLIEKDELSLITWNIGYCGLDKSMDFFYDGGKQVRPKDSTFQKNLNGVFHFLSENDSVDFILLQEVDTAARRSYYTNEVSLFSQALPNYAYCFSTNYNVKYVPLPVFNPMGAVVSGITTFSRFSPSASVRYAYPVSFAWPLKLVMLDRCFLLQRYPLANGQDLVLIHLHNSAFGNADVLRQYELWMLRGFLLMEYAQGNYVIAAGDWNENPPNYEKSFYHSGFFKKYGSPQIPKDYMPANWHYSYDSKTPTNRDVNEAYRPGLTPTTTLDFYLTSPNIVIDQVQTINGNFEFSDHQPVFIRVFLNNDPMTGCTEDCLDEVVRLKDTIQTQKEALPKKWVKKK